MRSRRELRVRARAQKLSNSLPHSLNSLSFSLSHSLSLARALRTDRAASSSHITRHTSVRHGGGPPASALFPSFSAWLVLCESTNQRTALGTVRVYVRTYASSREGSDARSMNRTNQAA